MRFMRRLLFLLTFLSPFLETNAQDFIGGFQVKTGIPIGDFKAAAAGILLPELAFWANYQIPKTPLEIGLSFGYGIYGTKLEKRDDLYVGFNDELRLRRNNNMLTMMGVFRFFPEIYGKVFPFIEAQAGGIYAYTRYKIRASIFEDVIEEDRDFSDWSRAYQLGGGVMIPFKSAQKGQLEIRLMYQNSTRLDYLTRQDTEYQYDPDGEVDGEFVYSTRRSPFTMIQPSIGASFYF